MIDVCVLQEIKSQGYIYEIGLKKYNDWSIATQCTDCKPIHNCYGYTIAISDKHGYRSELCSWTQFFKKPEVLTINIKELFTL